MWKDNLRRFPDLSYIEFNSSNKDKLDVEDLVKFDVVLSTYNLVAKQYHNFEERELDIKEAVQGSASRRVRVDRSTITHNPLDVQWSWAPLYGIAFHWVILDEAHRIRNTRSVQFRAMMKLDTRHRIACSGTAGAITMWKANLKMFSDPSYIEYNTYIKDEVDVKDLVKYDVVLSTYNLIAKQHSHYAERELDIKAAIQGQTSRSIGSKSRFEKPLDIQRPWAPLYGMAFHCVILDKAHWICNTRNMQFKAMSKLDTQRRIACSGTIFNNDYADVGAILTFLRYQPWCNPSSFSRYFLKGGKKRSGGARKRAQLKHLRGAVFKYTLDGIFVRRNKREEIEGKEIIDVEKLDYQKGKRSLDDTMGVIMIDYIYHTEQDAQMRTKELWSKQRPSEDEEDEEEEEEEEPME